MGGSNEAGYSKSRRRPRSCRFLLGILVLLLVAFPYLEDLARPRPLILVVPLAAVFVAGVLVVNAGRTNIRRALVIAAIPVGLGLVSWPGTS